MNDSNAPLTDEDLSAAIDGEADADTLARIEADPEARARQAVLAAPSTTIRAASVTELAATDLDRLISAAVDTPLAPARPERAGGGLPRWLVAAVIAVLVGVGLTLVWNGRNADDSAKLSTADRALASSSASESQADSSAGGASLPDHGFSSAPATTLSPEAANRKVATFVNLGTFSNGAALRTSLAKTFAPAASTTAQDSPAQTQKLAKSVDRCAEQLKVTLKLDASPQKEGLATVAGKQVLVYEFPHDSYADGTPTTLVTAVGAAACDQVVFFER